MACCGRHFGLRFYLRQNMTDYTFDLLEYIAIVISKAPAAVLHGTHFATKTPGNSAFLRCSTLYSDTHLSTNG